MDVQLIKETIANADRVLAMPEVIYPNGKNSHKQWSAIKEEYMGLLEDKRRFLVVEE